MALRIVSKNIPSFKFSSLSASIDVSKWSFLSNSPVDSCPLPYSGKLVTASKLLAWDDSILIIVRPPVLGKNDRGFEGYNNTNTRWGPMEPGLRLSIYTLRIHIEK